MPCSMVALSAGEEMGSPISTSTGSWADDVAEETGSEEGLLKPETPSKAQAETFAESTAVCTDAAPHCVTELPQAPHMMYQGYTDVGHCDPMQKLPPNVGPSEYPCEMPPMIEMQMPPYPMATYPAFPPYFFPMQFNGSCAAMPNGCGSTPPGTPPLTPRGTWWNVPCVAARSCSPTPCIPTPPRTCSPLPQSCSPLPCHTPPRSGSPLPGTNVNAGQEVCCEDSLKDWSPLIGASHRMKGKTTTAPASSVFQRYPTARRVTVGHTSQLKSLAGQISGRVRKGEAIHLVVRCVDSANNAIKAVCVARSFVQPNGMEIFCCVEWQSPNQLVICCVGGAPTDFPVPTDDDQNIRIAGKSAPPPLMTAGLVANRLRTYQLSYLLTMGGEAVMQSLRSLSVTHNFVEVPVPIWFVPKFLTINRNDGNRSAIQMVVTQVQPHN
eukprot:NODE_71_length_1674_cov_229.498462_g49_i0.p1 GENE.NODE_71_length_1674_cov_229.498462_g49_i0~~NODE_71_length_1674_cov_229.498462_g49_i0.p1  ORF type:complete len:438 (-),score=90.37 NODE_71_length_1674_cov_229.498462_g49_i0:299-1612(-)